MSKEFESQITGDQNHQAASLEIASLGEKILPADQAAQPRDPIVAVIQKVNASHRALRDLWSRTRRAGDAVDRSRRRAEESEETAEQAATSHQIAQSENPKRTAPRPRQLVLALVTVLLDGVACYFAAQALDRGPLETVIWAVLFVAVLAIAEVALDLCRRSRWWWLLLAGISAYLVVLGLLRYSYLATASAAGLVPAFLGAILFTAATAGFLALGFWALRIAETPAIWKARRTARRARHLAADGWAEVSEMLAEWTRLADAYIAEVRHLLLEQYRVDEMPAAEEAVRTHLLGGAR